jgi:hypothetical protein
MGRRYLSRLQVESALRRGKTVECFLGPCTRGGVAGIRHASVASIDGKVELHLFESADRGSVTHLDLYEFGPLDASLALGEADQVDAFESLDECLHAMEARWPGSAGRLLNEGMLQDEYRDYIARRFQS